MRNFTTRIATGLAAIALSLTLGASDVQAQFAQVNNQQMWQNGQVGQTYRGGRRHRHRRPNAVVRAARTVSRTTRGVFRAFFGPSYRQRYNRNQYRNGYGNQSLNRNGAVVNPYPGATVGNGAIYQPNYGYGINPFVR